MSIDHTQNNNNDDNSEVTDKEWPANEPMPPSKQKLYYPYTYKVGKDVSHLARLKLATTDELPKPATEKDEKKKKKEEAKEAKMLVDRLKLNMANERTFSKYVLMGMQMGAIGTFVLLTLDRRHNTSWGVITLGFAWVVGFAIAFYGMYTYYGRRRALADGDLSHDPASGRAYVPALIIFGLVAVVTSSLVYVGVAGLPAHSSTANAAFGHGA